MSILRICSSLLFVFLLGSCASTIRQAQQAEQRLEYQRAATLYASQYRRTPTRKPKERAYMAFHAAENYRRLRAYTKALNYYRSSERYGYPDSVLLLRLGQMLQTQGEYAKSLAYYTRYLNTDPTNVFALRGAEGCRMAQRDSLGQTAGAYQLRRANRWNSSRSDYAPSYSVDGSQLLFTSHRASPSDGEPSPITGEMDANLFVVQRDQYGGWSNRADTLSGKVNSPRDEGVGTLSSDGRTLYYSVAPQSGSIGQTVQIYQSQQQGRQGWGVGIPVDLWKDSVTMAAHPSLTPSGRTLFFVSERMGGVGGKDIYSVSLDGGGYGVPRLLGLEINSLGDELFPMAVSDSLLYFASDGHIGYGGLDLYRAQLLPSGRYLVSHLSAPINSPSDDLSITFDPKPNAIVGAEPVAQSGLLASSREDARGYPHLYEFSLPAIQTLVEGYVSDREGYAISGATIRLLGNKAGQGERVATTREDGSFRLALEGDVDYIMLASEQGYLNQYVRFRTDTATRSETYSVDFVLAARNTIQALPEVYYAFDRAELLESSYPQLDELVRILNDNPDVRIELTAHTDRRGSEEYNQSLSERRAESVVRYLISQGIEASRLVARGLGKAQPFVVTPRVAEQYPWLQAGQVLDVAFVESLEAEQQDICDALNRRTEFRTLGE